MTEIVVLGGSGFVGTRLCRRLQRAGRSFTILDKQPGREFAECTTIGDVRLPEDLRRAVPRGAVIVNLAAEHRDDVRPRRLYDEVNVGGAESTCAAARERDVRTIVFASSVAVYGFAPIGTDETGEIRPFNDYGRTKHAAEQVFRAWQAEAPGERSLVIVRPTVVFGEQNRGNVYNLMRQVASGRFVMVGDGENRKSMAYVENVAAFLEKALDFGQGLHLYNYADKPDFSMNELVGTVRRILGRRKEIGLRIPYPLGYAIGLGFDGLSILTGRRFPISAIRVKKFCSHSVYGTAAGKTGFVPPVPLEDAIERTVRHEFLESHEGEGVFFSE